MINCINIINFRGSRHFDKKQNKTYNKQRNSNGVDCFVKTKKMNLEELKNNLNKLNTSRKLNNSPVAFLGPLLTQYLTEQITEEDFKKIFEDKSTQAKVYLVYMGKDNIELNQKVFRSEFYLADRINHSIYEYNQSGEELKKNIQNFILDYNKSF